MRYQYQIINRLFHYEGNVPLWFGYTNRSSKIDKPFVHFQKLQNETIEKFLEMNPYITSCYSQNLTETALDRKFDLIFDISLMSQKLDEAPDVIKLYFKYISVVIDLYTVLAANENVEGGRSLRERIGATHKAILYLCMS